MKVLALGVLLLAVPLAATPKPHNWQTGKVNGYRFTLVEKPSKHYIVLAENSDVQFYQDGQWLVFLDVNKKEHKFSLLHMEKLPNLQQPANP